MRCRELISQLQTSSDTIHKTPIYIVRTLVVKFFSKSVNESFVMLVREQQELLTEMNHKMKKLSAFINYFMVDNNFFGKFFQKILNMRSCFYLIK